MHIKQSLGFRKCFEIEASDRLDTAKELKGRKIKTTLRSRMITSKELRQGGINVLLNHHSSPVGHLCCHSYKMLQ